MNHTAKSTHFLTRWGFTAGAVTFALLAVLAVLTVLKYREYARAENRSSQAIGKLCEIEALVERAETSERGYIMTKKASFLKPFNATIGAVGKEVAELKGIVAEFESQRRKADDLDKLMAGSIADMQKAIKISAEAKQELNTMSELRDVIYRMEHDQAEILQQQRAAAETFEKISLYMLGFVGLFALALMAVSARLIRAGARRNQEQNALITHVFDSMSDGLVVINKDLLVIHSNRASSQGTGFNLTGTKLPELYAQAGPVQDGDQVKHVDYRQSPLYRALMGEDVPRTDLQMGEDKRIYSVDSCAVRNDDGQIVAAFCTYRDITQRRETEQEWQNAREAALQASRLKSDFLATMSHEIRTPMNGVMGMATLLLNTKMTDEQESYVRTIKSSADSLLSLINQVLDHSKIESGKLELELSDFELSAVIEGVMSLFRYLARSKNIDLKVRIEDDVPSALKGDPNRLRQILLNLVGNALKFTEQGFIELHVKTVAGHPHKAEFSVKDTGPGIPQDKQGHLFQKFSQVHDSRYVKAAGSGLGLMISRELVRVMGGEMGLESAVGFGSRFWFTAQFAAPETAGVCEWKPKVQHENLRGRILVAEDQVVNQMVVQKFLASFGLECVIAEEGGAAVQKAKEEHFDLILMDCRMIPVDGYEATRQIRAFNPAIPIVALTAEGISGERALCFEAGMNEVLTKPVEIDRLYRTLKQYLARPEFNEAQLDKLAGYESGGKPLIEALKEDFYVSALELCRSLRAAWKDGDDEKMKHYAHALRSPSLTLGMAGLAALCEEIEDSTVPVEANKIDQLDEMYNRACAWLGRQGLSSKAS